MERMKKGFTLVELLIVIAIIAILAALLLPVLSRVIEKSRQGNCKSNLKQLFLGLAIYKQEFGDNIRYPDANGAGFLTRLYQHDTKDVGWKLYICPSTADTSNKGEDLKEIKNEDDDMTNACSYAGRKNGTAGVYPALIASENKALTTIASDDFDQPTGQELNHPKLANFLFLDGHVENIRIEHEDYDDYKDPLTN